MDVVFSFATRVIVLADGQVLIDGAPDTVRSDKRVREAYFGEDIWWNLRVSAVDAGCGQVKVIRDANVTVRAGEAVVWLAAMARERRVPTIPRGMTSLRGRHDSSHVH